MRSVLIPDLDVVSMTTTIRIDFPLGTFYGAVGDGKTCPVIDMEPVFIRLGTSATSTRLTLDNTGMTGQRTQTMWDSDHPPEGSAVTIEVEINGTGYRIFTGIVQKISGWTRDRVVVDCMDSSAIYRKILGTLLDKDTYANIPEENIGLIQPWVWGTVNSYKPLLVDEDVITELSASMISTDVTATVKSTDGFASIGTIRINNEHMTYTGITAASFTGLTRGVNDAYGDPTVASSHVPGNQVMEVGELKFIVSHHAIATGNISEVRYLGRDGIEIPAAAADYTIDYGSPCYITFDQAPVFDEATSSHKLKVIDYEADTGSSDCENPTYAAGGHADWDEYNYATIDNNETLELELTTAVEEPGGELLRMWAVVEYAKNFDDGASHHGEVSFNGVKLGDLPDKSNTPDTVKSDQSLWLMSAGFEDDHIHEMPDGDHQHELDGSGSSNWPPSIDFGDYDVSTWGTFTEAYDGDWDTYDTIHLNSGYVDTTFKYLYTSEGVNIFKQIIKMRIRMKMRLGTGGSLPCEVWSRYYLPNDNGIGSASYQYVFFSQKTTADMSTSPDWDQFDSGWVAMNTGSDIFLSADLANSKVHFWKNNPGNCYLNIADMQIDLILAPVEVGVWLDKSRWSYEPCGWSIPNHYPNTVDMDWGTYTTGCIKGTVWTFTAVSQYDATIKGIMVAAVGSANEVTGEWRLQLTNATSGTHTFDYVGVDEGSTVSRGYYDLTAYDYIGSDLLTPGSKIQLMNIPAGSDQDIIEVGLWVLYEDHYTGMTGMEEIGNSDEQEGSYSSLAWFDLSAADGWQYPVNKDLKVYLDGTAGDEVKVLRAFTVGEFAPMEKRMATEIVCDVVGRTGTFEQVFTDVLTDSDLLAIPAASVSIPTISAVAAGALQEAGDGWDLVSRLLDEAGCHGYWSFDGLFKIKLRPAKASLADPTVALTKVFKISRSRKDLDSLINKIESKYNWNFTKETMGDSLTRETAASQTKYGKTGEMGLDLQFHRVEANAETITDTIKSYMDELFEDVDLEVGLMGLNLEPGDMTFIEADGMTADKVEIKEVRIINLIGDMLTVEVKGVTYG